MKLLRNISVTVLLALALSACVKETVTAPSRRDSAVVSFLPATYSSGTKAVSGYVFPTDQSFGCFAFYSPDGSDWGTYMDNQEVTYNSLKTQWLPTLDYYWPRINKVSFLSYAPYSATPWITGATARSLVAENVAPQPDDDWMYADIAADYNANAGGTDVTDDLESGTSDSGFDGVPTFFRHALTRIAINIKARTIAPGAGTGTIVNIGDEYEGERTYTPWTVVSETVDMDDDGTHAIRTTTTIRQRTETIQMSQTTVMTEVDRPSGWTIKVTEVSFADAVTSGTLELDADTHTFGTAERVGLVGGWSPAGSSAYGTIPLESLLVDIDDNPVPLTDTYQPLIEERSMIPQTLDRITLRIKYTSKIEAADAVITTTVDTWERTRTFTETHVLVKDVINNKHLQDETDETFEDTDGAKTTTTRVERPENHNTEVLFDKNVPFYGQGGLTEWAMNKKITYNITIEPTGKRITWDPAQVDDWGSHPVGSIVLQ